MSGDHDACPNCGAGAMWCDCDPDRKVEREAYIRGAKDALRETVEIVLDKRFAYLVIAQAGVESVAALLENRIDRGEWPPKE